MRNYALIIGIFLLLSAFAAAWFLLQPNENQPTGTGNFEENLATLDNSNNTPTSLSNEEGDTDKPNDPLSPTRTDDQPVDPEDAGPGQPTGEIIKDKSPAEAVTPERNTTNPGGDSAEVEDPAAETSQPQKFIKGHKRPPGQNLGNTRPTSRRIGKPAGVKKLDEVTTKLRQDRRGLLASYASLQKNENGQWLPDANKAYTRIDREIWFPDAESFSDLPMPLDNFGATWTGFLVIETAGDYWFFLGADNGGRVELDGETVLLQDGMVRYVEVSAVLTLEPGLHPIKIEFAQQMNGVADAAKCAAAFMYVPDGQTKPVAVPPEMLMVPEWMWSDNAPIITSLSQTEGEIGDEITINGQGFGPADDGTLDAIVVHTRATFAGYDAAILSRSDSTMRVKVPIGAKTGSLIVYRSDASNGNHLVQTTEIPSNSVEFIITTQFGLMAEWHDLSGWSNFGYEVFEGAAPDVVRLEHEPGAKVPPNPGVAFAVSWTGKLGVEALPGDARRLENGERSTSCTYEFHSTHTFRMTFDGVTKQATRQETFFDASPHINYCTFTRELNEDSYVGIRVELLAPAGGEIAWRGTRVGPDLSSGIAAYRELGRQHYFPPEPPPEPPVISSVKAVWAKGEQPAIPIYDADDSRPSIAVGQEFDFSLSWSLANDARHLPIVVAVDSIPVECTETSSSNHGGGEHRSYRAVMPEGVGEGKLTVTVESVSSEPHFIDIANRGLVAYLYDVPDAGGLRELPDLAPLTCFKVRKDRQINFESVADFDLPFPAETFVIEWLGGLIIEEEGDYEFICRSDDGMKLWLDDNVVIDADHPQAPAENTATVHLVPGVYRFRMQFFENNQHEVCVLEWRATRGEDEALEELIPRQVIPARAFSLDVHPPFPAKTSTGKRTDGS